MTKDLPYSQASENNKLAILDVFKRYLSNRKSMLEIGGGTGQHAVFFAAQFPLLQWQSTDIPENVDSLNLRLTLAKLENVPPAYSLNVDDLDWQCQENHDVIFTANSLHIMSAVSVENFFVGVGKYLPSDGLLMVYGPFKYAGNFTTESNANFDVWLKDRNPHSGVRDFEKVNELAAQANLELLEDNAMPANNQLLIWKKR